MTEREERLHVETAKKLYADNRGIFVGDYPQVRYDDDTGGAYVEARVYVPSVAVQIKQVNGDIVEVSDGLLTIDTIVDERTVDVCVEIDTQPTEKLEALSAMIEVELQERGRNDQA